VSIRAAARALLRIAVMVALGLLLVVYPMLYLMQDRLLFLRAPMDPRLLDETRKRWPGAEIRIPVSDDVTLHGWFVPAAAIPGSPAAARSPLLIYFGGNAEEVTAMLSARERLPGWGFLLVNYRGYGLSGGQPSQAALQHDAVAIYDWARGRAEVDAERIVAWGRSLGTGVAVHLAAHRALAGVVLVSPYDSLAAVAQGHYPYAPVRWLFRHPFDAAALAPAIRSPLLALAMANDRIMPADHSRRLVAAWGGPRELVVFDEGDHNHVPEPAYRDTVGAFLRQLAPAH
jgi:pimeloyl-ACP methyl ester carboxylesterase